MPKPRYRGILASSEDPTKLSLSVSSAGQMLISLVAFYAVHKGLDPATATSNVQGIMDLGVNLVPAVLATYHGLILMWGLLRKALAFFKTQPVPTQATSTPVTVVSTTLPQ